MEIAARLALVWCVLGLAETSRMYIRVTSEDRVFQHLFLGPNSNVLSVFPQCLQSAGGSGKESTEVRIDTVNWTEAQFEHVLRQRQISALNLSLAMSVIQLLDVNERDRKITISVRVILRWNDCRLSWSQSEYSAVSNITIPPSRFRSLDMFVPEALLLQQTNPFASLASETEIRVTSQGSVQLDRLYTTVVSCTLDVAMYPFDSHVCNLTFETLFNSLEVNMFFPLHDTVQDMSRHLLGNGRFVISDTFQVVLLPAIKTRRWQCSQVDFSGQDESENLHCFTDRLTFRLLLRRHPRYYIIHLFIPAFLCVLCSVTVFIITPGYMDKVFPSTFTMVSVLVFITSTYAEMPETGYTFSWMSIYYFVCIFIVALNCIYSSISSTMAVVKLPVPKPLRNMVVKCSSVILFDILPRGFNQKQSSNVLDGNVEVELLESEEKSEVTAAISRQRTIKIEWRHVVACFDRFYFMLLLPLSVGMISFFILVGLRALENAFDRHASEEDWSYINEQLRTQAS